MDPDTLPRIVFGPYTDCGLTGPVSLDLRRLLILDESRRLVVNLGIQDGRASAARPGFGHFRLSYWIDPQVTLALVSETPSPVENCIT